MLASTLQGFVSVSESHSGLFVEYGFGDHAAVIVIEGLVRTSTVQTLNIRAAGMATGCRPWFGNACIVLWLGVLGRVEAEVLPTAKLKPYKP